MRFLPSDVVVCDSLIEKMDFFRLKEKNSYPPYVDTLIEAAKEAALRVALVSAPLFIALSIAYHLLCVSVKLPLCVFTIPLQLTNGKVPESLRGEEFYNHLAKIYCLVLFSFACPISVCHSSKSGIEIYKILMGQASLVPQKFIEAGEPEKREKVEEEKEKDCHKVDESSEDVTALASGSWEIVVTPPSDETPIAPLMTPPQAAKLEGFSSSQKSNPLPINLSPQSSAELGSRNLSFPDDLKAKFPLRSPLSDPNTGAKASSPIPENGKSWDLADLVHTIAKAIMPRRQFTEDEEPESTDSEWD